MRSVQTTKVKILPYRPTKLNKMFIIWRKQETLNSFDATGLCMLTDILIANGDELNLILQKFARLFYFFFSSGFLALHAINKYC